MRDHLRHTRPRECVLPRTWATVFDDFGCTVIFLRTLKDDGTIGSLPAVRGSQEQPRRYLRQRGSEAYDRVQDSEVPADTGKTVRESFATTARKICAISKEQTALLGIATTFLLIQFLSLCKIYVRYICVFITNDDCCDCV